MSYTFIKIILKNSCKISSMFHKDKLFANIISKINVHFLILLQHVVFGICRLIDVLVPDIPESLELKIKRERYLAKQALQDSDTIMKICQISSRMFILH
uniref:Uncharacterized protein n=1 Tax=Timema shepardi TaxID=629360 RepID=A0A7R9AVC7_TIMSH|nr:unnamed protein product [Timema shepardi]